MRRLRLRRIKMWILTRWKTKRKERGRAGNTRGIKRKRYTHAHTYVLLEGEWSGGLWDRKISSCEFCVCVMAALCVLNLWCSAKVTLYIYSSASYSHKHTFFLSWCIMRVRVCKSNLWSYDHVFQIKNENITLQREALLSSETCMCASTDSRVLYITSWFIDVCSVQSDGMKHADVSSANCLSTVIIQTKHTYTAYIHHTQTDRHSSTHLIESNVRVSPYFVFILVLEYLNVMCFHTYCRSLFKR